MKVLKMPPSSIETLKSFTKLSTRRRLLDDARERLEALERKWENDLRNELAKFPVAVANSIIAEVYAAARQPRARAARRVIAFCIACLVPEAVRGM